MGQRVGCGLEQHLARWPLGDPEHTNGRSRRDGAVQPRPIERVLLPPKRTLVTGSRISRVGSKSDLRRLCEAALLGIGRIVLTGPRSKRCIVCRVELLPVGEGARFYCRVHSCTKINYHNSAGIIDN
jgi:hypothetical protein